MPSSSCDDGQPQQAGAAASLSFPTTAEEWDEKFKDPPYEVSKESEKAYDSWLKQQAVGEAFGHEEHLTDKVKEFIIKHFRQLAANGVVLGFNVENTSGKLHLTTYLHKECDELEEMANDCQIHPLACPRKMTKDDLYLAMCGFSMAADRLKESTQNQLSEIQRKIQALKNEKLGWYEIQEYSLIHFKVSKAGLA